jgi:hypothetical protein
MRRRPLRHVAAVLLAALACDAEVTRPAEEPVLALSAREVRLFAPAGSVTPDRARVIVSNNGGGTLEGLSIGTPVYEDVTGWLTATLTGDTIELAASAQALTANTRVTARLDVYLAAAPEAPRTVTVVFDVGLTQRILLSADSLTFVAISALGTVPPPQTVTVQNAGTGILTELAAPEISPASAQAWLAAAIDDSTAPARVRLSLVPAGIPAPGEYAATVVVSSRIAEPERDSVAVTLIVAPPVSPVVSADSVFIDVVEGAAPVARQVWVDEVSRRPLSAAVSADVAWLGAAPDPIDTPGRLSLTATPAGLAPGTHVGRVIVTAGTGRADTVVVALRIRPGPALSLGVDRVRFTTYRGGPVPPAQEVRVENAGDGTLAGLAVQVQPDAGWLVVPVPAPDTAPAAFTVAIDPASAAWQALYAAGGTETRNVVVSGTGVTPVTLPVTLEVRDGPALVLSSGLVRFVARDTAASGTPNDSVEIAVANGGPGTLASLQVAVTYQDSAGWLGVSPGASETPFALRLRPLTRLPAGTYRATVSVFSAADSAALQVEYTAVDSLATADRTLVSSDTLELRSGTVGGTQPRALLWLENASSGEIALNVSALPAWLGATFTESNRRTPTGLVLEVDRAAGDTVGVYATTLLVTGTSGGATVAPVPVRVRLVMAGPAMAATADDVTLRTWEGRAPLPTQPVIVSNGATGTLSGVRVTGAPGWLVAEPTTASPAPAAILLRAQEGLAAGSYAGSVTIASTVATNSPLTLPVTLTVDPGPALAVSPAAVTLASVEGDTLPVTDTVVVFNAGKGVLGTLAAPVVSPAGEWLSAVWDTGGTAASPPPLIVRANPRGLTPATLARAGTVTVDSPDPGSAAVEVTFDVAPAPTLRRSPALLTFTATEGLPLPADTQTIAVFDPEGRPTGGLDVSVNGDTTWFAWDQDSSGVPAAVRVWPVTVPPASDSAYTAVVTVTARAGADTVRSVLQYVVARPEGPVIDVSRDTLVFDRVNPLAQTVQITNGGSGTLRELSVADITGTDWLFVLLDSRIAPATLTVAVNAAAAANEPANSVATLRITGEDADPRTITVILR